MDYLVTFVGGTIFGVVLVLAIVWLRRSQEQEMTQQLFNSIGARSGDNVELILARVKESFQALSMEALSKSTDEFLKLATVKLDTHTTAGEKDLEGKKKLIDEALANMNSDLEKLREVIKGLEKDRENKFGELTTQIKETVEQTKKLQETTNDLRAALVGTKIRGQWGERMAEDVINLIGLKEGINYTKQKITDGSNRKPDFTFFLPQGQKVNMDVKFPLNNYLRYLETDSISDKESHKKDFLKDVRNRIKEVTNRDYIDPAQQTVDYVIIFIPNEQVFNFVTEHDRSLLDDALKTKVILCSPTTLFAVLAVIRQAVANFQLEKATADIVRQFGLFNKQWFMFVGAFEKLGKKLDEAQSEFQALRTTRVKQLDKPLLEIEKIKEGYGINSDEIQ